VFAPPSFLARSAPLAFLTVLTILYQRASIVMLSLMTTSAQTGIFSVSFRMVEASKTLHLAAFAALYPAMSKAHAGDADGTAWGRALSTSWRALLAGALVIAAALYAAAPRLVPVLFGNAFDDAAALLRIQVWILIPFTVNTYLTLAYLAAHQERRVAAAFTLGLLALLALNSWLIPLQGPSGCAWASLVAECAQSGVLLAGLKGAVRAHGGFDEFPELS
jgi:O-antigen/teichoic acid export membrane protein